MVGVLQDGEQLKYLEGRAGREGKGQRATLSPHHMHRYCCFPSLSLPPDDHASHSRSSLDSLKNLDHITSRPQQIHGHLGHDSPPKVVFESQSVVMRAIVTPTVNTDAGLRRGGCDMLYGAVLDKFGVPPMLRGLWREKFPAAVQGVFVTLGVEFS